MDREIYNDQVEAIYDAALDSSLWTHAITGLKASLNSIAAGFFVETHDHKLVEHHMVGLDAHQMDIYGEHYAKNNPWFTVPGLMKPGRVLTDHSLEKLHNDKNAFYKTEMCQEWSLTQDFRHLMGGNLIDLHGNNINFSFFRSAQDGYYTDHEINNYYSLCRHLIKAVELNGCIENIKLRLSTSEDVLNALRLGVVTLGRTARIEYMNDYARKIIYSDQGLFEHCSRIRAQDKSSSQILSAAIDQAYRHNKSTTVVINRMLKTSLSVSVISTRESRGFLGIENNVVTLFITDPDDRDIDDTEYLERRWNLTPVEAKFSCHLLQGLSISDIAEVMALTQNTARWYSKQVMRKLDVKRQSALIIKLMKDVAAYTMPR